MNKNARLEHLLPHREPMLLLDDIIAVDTVSASAVAIIKSTCAFYIPRQGVPAWVGLEIMGQTAALIAGHQQEQGHIPGSTGFLLGCRNFEAQIPWLSAGSRVVARCTVAAMVGTSLATFDCSLDLEPDAEQSQTRLSTAQISVFRETTEQPGEAP